MEQTPNQQGGTNQELNVGGEVPGTDEARREIEGPRIYVASLSDYNAGILHGRWIDASLQPEEIEADIAEMLADSPTTKRYGDVAEEIAIHDYEGFGLAHVDEYTSIRRVSRLAQGIERFGEAFSAWWAQEERDDTDAADVFTQYEQQYFGRYDTFEAYGEDLLEDLGFDAADPTTVPESLRPYVRFDLDAWLRDLHAAGDMTVVETTTGVYVFWPE